MDNKVKLLSSDNKVFDVEVLVVQECKTLKTMIEDIGAKDAIHLETVCSKVLAQVIDYCQHHVELHTSSDGDPAIAQDEVRKWDAEFIKMDYNCLVGLIQAANFLDLKGLLNLACQGICEMLIGKTAEEVIQLGMIKKFDHRRAGREHQAGE